MRQKNGYVNLVNGPVGCRDWLFHSNADPSLGGSKDGNHHDGHIRLGIGYRQLFSDDLDDSEKIGEPGNRHVVG